MDPDKQAFNLRSVKSVILKKNSRYFSALD
ncbi:MAG: hypothetical protein UX87_C0030G0007 [Candidatus Amesbacteria bacterium GW2011_GWA1_47_16]|uniref:Uncharacterized protein n=2 Tax=Candidatus Amesiibacteriota TaxID=1752730 RepID=A0A0G1URS0_9BACT|nr:MAG: hypothetical protein UX87_C0030G0007 [Candidatus Amesbacteria bacterium GW2011_GWA1_47_16]KKU96864.1 MAG: hypothetical protein UY28_C0029G0015 [Candidatus Amesbacteria bacterium GW2011_GWB1_48_13]